MCDGKTARTQYITRVVLWQTRLYRLGLSHSLQVLQEQMQSLRNDIDAQNEVQCVSTHTHTHTSLKVVRTRRTPWPVDRPHLGHVVISYTLFWVLTADTHLLRGMKLSVSSVFEVVSLASTIVLGVCVQRGDHQAARISQVSYCSLFVSYLLVVLC